ncbi:MAG: agmatine/peptidylarginine deiminase [Pirellulaceae bacterium]
MNTASPHFWPAEWEPQSATWISWPHNQDTWPNRFASIPGVFYRFIQTLAEIQLVRVLFSADKIDPQSLRVLEQTPNVELIEIATNDAWIRDYGPTFVKRSSDQSLVGICWKFNAWGDKYPPYDLDAAAGRRICESLKCARSMSSLYCEGGALETNGKGIILTSSSCLVNPNRNPGWSQQMVTEELQMQLGAEQVVWVDGGGLAGDDTDGHIDQLARFVDERTVVAAVASQGDDPNASGLEANLRILRGVQVRENAMLNVVRLPTPPPRFIDGQRVPESYCNFLIANQIVLMPSFRNPITDQAAHAILTSLFPSRTVVPMDAFELVWGLGAFHCASQQQPVAKP